MDTSWNHLSEAVYEEMRSIIPVILISGAMTYSVSTVLGHICPLLSSTIKPSLLKRRIVVADVAILYVSFPKPVRFLFGLVISVVKHFNLIL